MCFEFMNVLCLNVLCEIQRQASVSSRVCVWVCICLCELEGCREREAEGKFEGMRITGLTESSASQTVD